MCQPYRPLSRVVCQIGTFSFDCSALDPLSFRFFIFLLMHLCLISAVYVHQSIGAGQIDIVMRISTISVGSSKKIFFKNLNTDNHFPNNFGPKIITFSIYRSVNYCSTSIFDENVLKILLEQSHNKIQKFSLTCYSFLKTSTVRIQKSKWTYTQIRKK